MLNIQIGYSNILELSLKSFLEAGFIKVFIKSGVQNDFFSV